MPFSREKRKVRRRRSETSCTVVILKEASNIPSIPVVGLGPHGQLAEVGSGVVDDGLVHVVPEAETLGLGTSLDLLGGVKGPVAGALNAVARQRDVISYVTGRERGNMTMGTWSEVVEQGVQRENSKNLGFFPGNVSLSRRIVRSTRYGKEGNIGFALGLNCECRVNLNLR